MAEEIKTANTESVLRGRLRCALAPEPEGGRTAIPLEDMLDNIIFALDCDPGHDATDGLVEPCADRSAAVGAYRHIIRSALSTEDSPDGGTAF